MGMADQTSDNIRFCGIMEGQGRFDEVEGNELDPGMPKTTVVCWKSPASNKIIFH